MFLKFISSVSKRLFDSRCLHSKRRSFHTTFLQKSEKKYTKVPSGVLDKLVSVVGEKNVSTAKIVRETYGKDESHHHSHPPEAVVFAHSTEHVSEIAKICYEHTIPMVPHGAGTGLEQGVGALQGGICVDLGQMKSVLNVSMEDFDAVVEPGVTWRELNQHLRQCGMFFSVDPGADATLGGMAATSASGTNAVRYGTMRENVINMEVVLSDGTVFHTAGEGRHTKKTAAGYNLTNLFVGSEGTLGFFTKLTVKLHAIPETKVSAVCCFQTEKDAVDSVIRVLQTSIPVARIEFVDDIAIQVANKYATMNCPVSPSLFLEFHGSSEETTSQTKAVEDIMTAHGGSNFMWTNEAENRSKLWKARHQLYYAVLAEKPGWQCHVTDVCVPISNLTEALVQAKKTIVDSGLFGTVIGHVGDGNFHAQILFDPDDQKQLASAKALVQDIANHALQLNGSCTGEHGIGIGKKEFLLKEFGAEGLRVMQATKKALDPKLLMNPGKIFCMDNFKAF